MNFPSSAGRCAEDCLTNRMPGVSIRQDRGAGHEVWAAGTCRKLRIRGSRETWYHESTSGGSGDFGWRYGTPQRFDAFGVVTSELVGVELVEEILAQTVVRGALFQHMVNDDEQGAGQRDESPFCLCDRQSDGSAWTDRCVWCGLRPRLAVRRQRVSISYIRWPFGYGACPRFHCYPDRSQPRS